MQDTLPNTNGDYGRDTLVGVERIKFKSGGVYDVATGGTGNDTLHGGKAYSIIIGDGGNDYLDGGKSNDTLDGGTGNDHIMAELATTTLMAELATTTWMAGTGNDYMDGGTGNDVVHQGGTHTEYNIRILDNSSIELQVLYPILTGILVQIPL